MSFPRTIEAALEKARTINAELIPIDLHNQRFDPIAFANGESFPDLATIPMLYFFSMEVELQRRAFAAGIDRVVPRSVFARDLGGILKVIANCQLRL